MSDQVTPQELAAMAYRHAAAIVREGMEPERTAEFLERMARYAEAGELPGGPEPTP